MTHTMVTIQVDPVSVPLLKHLALVWPRWPKTCALFVFFSHQIPLASSSLLIDTSRYCHFSTSVAAPGGRSIPQWNSGEAGA